MTVADILEITTCPVQITGEEDPNDSKPNITLNALYPSNWLADEVLLSEVHLISVVNGNISISIGG